MADVMAPPTPPHEAAAKDEIMLDIDWSQVNLEEIQLPPGDDLGIHSDEEEDDEPDLETESGFGNIIVVDNLPEVPPEKYEKLVGVIRKIFARTGTIRENGLWMPVDSETKQSKGYAFIEYNTPQEADVTKEQTDEYKLDKNHVFKVTKFDDFEKYSKVPDQYAPPEKKPYQPKEDLLWWLQDERARDQFVIRYAAETEVYWNDARLGKPDLVYHRPVWTESFVQWSPLGSYIATVHRPGAAIWGGESWGRLARFAHPQVRLLDFSPGERYLVTYSSQEPANPRDTQKVTLSIWDIRSGKKLREIAGNATDFAVGGAAGVAGIQWPIFHWAGGRDDKYFARLGKNAISVYDTKDMGLLDKKSVKAEGVASFSWSPLEPLLALYTPETQSGNNPARVSLVAIPSRVELRQKNLFSVSECKMYWHPAGEYLAVKVDRYTKTKKSTYPGFELFRIKERDIPIEVLEIENKNEKVVAFAWEPKGHRFALIHGEGPRPDVSFYSMKSKTGQDKLTLLTTLKAKQANALYWSPQGKFIVLAGLKAINGQLEFYNVDELETMATGEHYMATDVDWDPTGRFVATSVTAVQPMENGFQVWSFQGKLLYRVTRDRFFQFLWRPRPASLLDASTEAEILKNLKDLSKKYLEEDEAAEQGQNKELLEKRRQLMDEFKARQEHWHKFYEEERELRRSLRDGEESDDEEDYEYEEVEVEEVIAVTEEIVG